MLNKLKCHATSNFQPIRLLDPGFLIEIHIFNDSADQKPTDLDLHCLLRQGMLCLAREELTLIPCLLKNLNKNIEDTQEMP